MTDLRPLALCLLVHSRGYIGSSLSFVLLLLVFLLFLSRLLFLPLVPSCSFLHPLLDVGGVKGRTDINDPDAAITLDDFRHLLAGVGLGHG